MKGDNPLGIIRVSVDRGRGRHKNPARDGVLPIAKGDLAAPGADYAL